ncbi:ubiquitin carboxyl-terminal hydrolase 36 [Caerostris extrusa]|uniref:Ubiquitin carboxyl-terminal hydrolase 36 n=1 Tax=Caerostris extrusa TaxID=172846 RepID=A0AAV4TV75_CAEEX|nr:ubiquitin carboxyl-terminal hydrolase 36 [Caerostris extrusa]
MNSAIASNINGILAADKDSLNQKIANGSKSSVLLGNIEFSVSGVKKPITGSNISGKYLCKVGENEVVCNGQKKQKNCIDQNRNTYNNSYTNGNNKEQTEDGMPVPKVELYTGRIHNEWKQIYKIGAGLNNLGNTCFMNTVIQCLTYCPPLANYLLHDNDHSSKCSVTGFCMMCVLQKHIRRSIGKTGDVIKPVDVYQRLKLIAKHFQFGRQEDAHEFLRYVIDNLWKSCLSQNNNCSNKETTVINRIFGGYHRSQVICLRCKEKSNTFDHFMDFILDIKNLEKALEKFAQPELLEQENSYKCPKCKMKVTAQKRFTVYRPPNVATFQLKRFDYNRSYGGKITKQISYPEKLNLRPFMSDNKGDPVYYRLNAVLVHSGPTCNSGHYYCYVKNSNGCWYIMDDQRVHQVSLNQVLNQSAYVLFYIKAEPSQAPSIKKCIENRSPVIKGNNSGINFKKNPEILAIKSSPLTERNQAKQSSPLLKHQLCPSLNANKKPPMSPNRNKETISSGVRPSMPTIEDIQKLEVIPPSKKVKQSQNTSKANNNHTGLVPYMKDSSESSDENESSKLVNPKKETVFGSSVSVPEKTKLDGAKNPVKINNKTVNENSPKIEIKRKLSRSLVNVNKSSQANSKVVATGSWTVTDASESSIDGSTSSCVSTSLATDWHVTSTISDSSVETVVNKSNCLNKENGQSSVVKLPEYSAPLSNNGIDSTPNQGTKIISHSNAQENGIDATSSSDDHNGPSDSKFSSKKCDFRRQSSQNEKSFLDNDKYIKQQQGSFLKRKYGDSDKKISENSSKFDLSENGSYSVFKKAKYSEELSELPSKNGLEMNNKFMSGKYNSEHQVKNSALYINKSSSNDTNSSNNGKSDTLYCEKISSKSEKNKDKRRIRTTDSVSSSGSSHSSVEYEWVEKTKDSIEISHSSKAKHDKKILPYMERREVITRVFKNQAKRKSLDDYEDEYDRGKIRKFKSKDRYNHYYKKNPFQNYDERKYTNDHKIQWKLLWTSL